MEPKFQSSFIPKGPVASGAGVIPTATRSSKGVLDILALLVFTVSVVLALGVFGYKMFLNYRIGQMSEDLTEARAKLEPGTIREFTRLNDRISSTGTLLNNHRILSPVFDFLEASTLKSVRFTKFGYTDESKGVEIMMEGQAQSYRALALQADEFSKSEYFSDTVFYNLTLNEVGNVVFSMRTKVDPKLISYAEEMKRNAVVIPPSTRAATTTTTGATSSSATTTPR